MSQQQLAAVNAIMNLQAILESAPAVTTNMREFTNHFFAPGIYFRTLFVPKGYAVVGEIHKARLLNILLKGKASIITSTGERIIAEAPFIFLSEPGQKAGYAVSDVWYATIYPNPENVLDVNELENEHFVPSYEKLEALT